MKMDFIFLKLLVLFSCLSANAATFVFSTSDEQIRAGLYNQGKVYENWFYGFDSDSTSVGRFPSGDEFGDFIRSFYSFNLSSLSGSVDSAVLRLRHGLLYSEDITETVGFYDVSFTPQQLLNPIHYTSSHFSSNNLQDEFYHDLGSGKIYGSVELITGMAVNENQYSYVDIILNAEAIDDINNSFNGWFTVGASLLTPSDSSSTSGNPAEIAFSDRSYFNGDHRVTLTLEGANLVPVPATGILFLSALTGFFLFGRRKIL